MDEDWIDIGATELLGRQALQRHKVGRLEIALSCVAGQFGAVHNACNHVGGPLGEGALDGDYIVCPWHQWKFHRVTGLGEPGFEDDRVPAFPVKVESGRVLINVNGATARHKAPHAPHPLARPIVRADGPIRVAGISTTAMDQQAPRYSGSDDLLNSRAQGRRRRRLRNPADQAQRSEIPCLRGILLEKRARLHLAVFDHPDACRRRTRRGL